MWLTKVSIRILGLSSLLIVLAFTTAKFSSSTPITFAQDSTSFVGSLENLVKEVNNLSQTTTMRLENLEMAKLIMRQL